ncbi:MAG: ATP-binding protein [Planctomycetaceae bacterium]|nr:ATP-binding protein [Planctomycetaceae bacterium]
MRSDLIIRLVQAGVRGDKNLLRKVIESIIAEERAKHHGIFADNLQEQLNIMQVERPISNGTPLLDQRVNNLFHEIIPKRKFSDLILSEDNRQICDGFVQEHHRIDLLRSYNLEPRNRILLVGPPGNGKTSLAEAFAESLFTPLYVVRYDSIIGTYLGETAVRLKKLFEHVTTRQCVLFFDEFETLGKERGDIHETGEIKRVVSSLLLQVDDLPSHVVVIGATNHPELLDKAVWRRFQIRMNLPAPTLAQKIEWIELFEKRIKISLGTPAATIAKNLPCNNYAEIEEFGTTVFRQYILNLPDASMKEIVKKTLKNWASRSIIVQQDNRKEITNE